jgi:hypothetical protein
VRRRAQPRELPDWVVEESLDEVGLHAATVVHRPATSWQRRRIADNFWAFHLREALPVAGWYERRACLQYGVEPRSPFWDLRVVEFTLRLPAWTERSGGSTKEIMRAAMRPRLPAMISERKDKSIFDELIGVGLIEQEPQRVTSALVSSPLGRLTFIDASQLEAELEGYRLTRHRWWQPLWRAITAGLWLNQVEGTHIEQAAPAAMLGALRR